MSENTQEQPPKRRKLLPRPKPKEEEDEKDKLFYGMRIFLHDRINPARRRVLRNLITQNGGITSVNADDNVTHILVDETVPSWKLCNSLQWHCYVPQNIHVLIVGWVSACLRANRILNGRQFIFSCPRGPVVTTILSSSSEDADKDTDTEELDASCEDNITRGPRFALPTFPRVYYENSDYNIRKFWSPLETGSAYDDEMYDAETTCDDEWLLIPVPALPATPPPRTLEDLEAAFLNVGSKEDDLKNSESVKDASIKEDTSKEAKDAGCVKVKKASKKKDCKKSEDTTIYNPGPSTSSDVNLAPVPMVPFHQRPDNAVGRLSRLRLKGVPNPDGSENKYFVVVNKSKSSPDTNDSTAQPAVNTAEHNLPDESLVSSNTMLPKENQLAIANLNGEDMLDSPSQRGHKRKKSSASSEDQWKNERGISSKKKSSKHKRKHSKCDSIPNAQQETPDHKEPAKEKRKKKKRLPKKIEENTSDSSSVEQDESTRKISPKIYQTKLEKPYVQGETSNFGDLSISEEKTRKYKKKNRKSKKSFSTPASPVSEGIGEKFPHKNKKKSRSAPTSPNTQRESVETSSLQKYIKSEHGKHASASALPKAEGQNIPLDKNVNDSSENVEVVLADKEAMIRMCVNTFFAANEEAKNGGENENGKKRKRSDVSEDKIPTLGYGATPSEIAAVIEYAKSLCLSAAAYVSDIVVLPKKPMNEFTSKDSLKDIKASKNEKFNALVAEEMESNEAVDEASNAENSAVKKSQSTSTSPIQEEAILRINKLCKVDSKVDRSITNEAVSYPVELLCSLEFDVELRLSELFFAPKTDRVIAEMNFLQAELERRKYGSGSWQIKNFSHGKSQSTVDEEERIKDRLQLGYWECSTEINNAAKPIPFYPLTAPLDIDESIDVKKTSAGSFNTPAHGKVTLFDLPKPMYPKPLKEVISADVTMNGTEVVKHFLSPKCPNYKIIQKLQQLYDFFKRTKDIWRMHAYEQAIFALGKHPTLITNLKEIQSIRGVGRKIGLKVLEIIQTGTLQEVTDFCRNEWITARRLLSKGWGINYSKAKELFKANRLCVTDVWTGRNLNRTQRLGLKYYEHLSKKMTRDEADIIFTIVERYIRVRNGIIRYEACSTIRRNKKFCGRVSIMVIMPKGVVNGHQFLDDTVAAMHREAYIIDDLVRHADNGSQCRYSGLFQINRFCRFRRLDLTIVPYIEQVCARFFLTGPSYYVRAVIKYAERHLMILDRHCLRLIFLDAIGGVESVNTVHLSTEEDLFRMLELDYRPPEQRHIIPFSTIVKK